MTETSINNCGRQTPSSAPKFFLQIPYTFNAKYLYISLYDEQCWIVEHTSTPLSMTDFRGFYTMHKKTTINISINGLSHFFKQCHFVVSVLDLSVYIANNRNKRKKKMFLCGKRTHFSGPQPSLGRSKESLREYWIRCQAREGVQRLLFL